MDKEAVSIFWFRRDLRLDDNHGLAEALKSSYKVLPIFIFDKNILDDLEDNMDPRLTFIHKNIEEINEQLKSKRTSIHTYYSSPLSVFKEITEEYNIKEVYTNEDYEPYALERDDSVSKFLASLNIEFKSFKDQVIFAKEEVVKDDGKPYLVYTPYSKKWLSQLSEKDLKDYGSALDHDNWYEEIKKIHSLPDLGFERSDLKFPNDTVRNSTLQSYSDERDIPSKDSTSRLGVHLRFGTISVRKLVRTAKKHSETFLKELIWREFFMSILYHFPDVVDANFNSKYDPLKWRNNEDDFNKWKEGRTGFPLVDAGMRELNATGFMHNRVRMLVASFLTKHLLIDWKWGEAYFAQKLLDYELASNNGNWQWAAGTGVDAQPYFRVFNPDSQLKKFDPNEIYVKRWVSEYNTSSYPEPMVEHKEARERAISTYKEALS